MDLLPPRKQRYLELLRSRSPVQRLVQAAELSMAVRRMAEIGLRQRYPDATPEEIRARLAVRLHGREAALRLYGMVPDDAR